MPGTIYVCYLWQSSLISFSDRASDSSGCGHLGPRGVCDMEIGMCKCMMAYIKTKRDDGSCYCDSKKIVKTVYLFQDNTKTLPQKCLGIISLIWLYIPAWKLLLNKNLTNANIWC